MNIPVLIDLSTADVTTPIEKMSDRLSAAGQTIVLGMIAVFSVLALLWIVLVIMGKFFTVAPKAPKTEKAEKKEEPKAAPAAPAVQAPSVASPASNDGEIVAAITAAISVMLDKPQTAFRVVSFRQTSREAFRRNNISKN